LSWIRSKAVIGVVLIFIPQIAEAAGYLLPATVTAILGMIGAALGLGAARNWILQAGSFVKPSEK
jgi:hypothetical protein